MPKLQQLHRELNSQLIHGFEVDGRLTGLVVLGPKASSSPYTAEDTTFVSAIGQMTGVALQCVRVQQNVSRLDNMLQEKVRKVESQERQIAILKQQLASNVQEEPVESTPKLEEKSFQRGKMRGSSPEMIRVLDSARKVAESDSSVMIRGESGTGKELLAQAIHANSSRKAQEMVSVNCAALSPSLLESELFGHVKGAFTGAYKDTVGRFQMADKGTLFLDEIGDLPADVQVKLLRVLQERKFEPV
ncbi:MAG TPA: sigma-54-dependent Fis family transcriptional regulator, partial [Planctomycetaceae bacterium]|nr:sigma-54-dependent Fis family transcriptional regulator [Planctomycetaceae bacterium]